MNANISVFVICFEAIIYCYYIICMTVPLRHNLRQNICRLFHVLAQFLFTTSATELDYYHQRMNAQVTSRAA